MLVIRKEQMAAFAAANRLEFERRLCAHLAEKYPDRARALGDAGLRELVHNGAERAGQLTIRSEAGVAAFVELALTLGPDFDTEDPAREILAAKQIDGATRVAMVRRVLGLDAGDADDDDTEVASGAGQ